MPVCFLNTLTRVIPTLSSLWKQEKGQLPFLDVLLSKQSASDHQGSFITSVYRKKTYTGLLTNYFSFTPFKYKLGLIKTLIDRAYKINNTTQGFHNDIKNLSEILKRNMYPKIGKMDILSSCPRKVTSAAVRTTEASHSCQCQGRCSTGFCWRG